jgi:hypothetical protein
MFYYVSKIVWFFLTPSNALLTVAMVGLALTWTRYAIAGRRMTAFGLGGLVVAGLLPLGNVLMLPLEERFPAFVDDGLPVAGIIVLGGTFDTEATNVHGQMALNETGERLVALGEIGATLSDGEDHVFGGRQRVHAGYDARGDIGREYCRAARCLGRSHSL